MVWMLPSGRTDSTMPMCSSHTIEVAGLRVLARGGRDRAAGLRAQAYSASTDRSPGLGRRPGRRRCGRATT